MLNFGHRKSSCSGRFFASLEIKTIIIRLTMNYGFKFKDGGGRPTNMVAHEFVLPNPNGILMVKATRAQQHGPIL